eukprot:6133715-Prymnesium_polylepis.1
MRPRPGEEPAAAKRATSGILEPDEHCFLMLGRPGSLDACGVRTVRASGASRRPSGPSTERVARAAGC